MNLSTIETGGGMRVNGQWRARALRTMPEFGTAKMAGLVSAVLFVLCGLMVAVFGPMVPDRLGVNRPGIVAVGVTAVVAGSVIGMLPWQRWRRTSTLWLIPTALSLIALHNTFTGGDGFRYDVFFFVVFVWIGLMHPSGTSVKSLPVMIVAYLAPGIPLQDLGTLLSSLTYAGPVCVLVGECASLIAARIQQSEAAVRANEQRLRALILNATDAITILDADTVVRWDSPSIATVLGYEPDERIGTQGMGYVRPEHLSLAEDVLQGLFEDPALTRSLELQVRHKDGSWRWCEVRVRNLLDDPAVGGFVVNMTDVTERHDAEAVRRQLAAIVESSTDAITGQAVDGTILSWNSAAESMYHYPAEQVVGQNIRSLVPPERHRELDELLDRVAAGDAVANVETQRIRRDGVLIDVSLSMSPVRDSTGRVAAVAAIARDISATVRARRALADRESSFRLLFAANPQPMWVYDMATLRFLEVNDAAVRHYGHTREEFLRLDLSDIQRADVDETPRRSRRRTDSWRHVLADGAVIDVELASHRLEFGGRDAMLVAVRDVTDRNALDAQLRHQAFHDSLTGLANRALFQDRVHAALARRGEHRPVVLLLDLDSFKLVNDSLGHTAGDELLVEAARRLKASVRTGDTVARLGGDEFAVLLEACPADQAAAHATRILSGLSAPSTVEGHELAIAASIGIAVADDTVSAGDLVRNADVAMYRAKAAGGNRFELFRPAMFAATARRMELTAALRRAVDDGQLMLHFQPVVELHDGRIASMEALVRWQHPDYGVMSPAEFIPIAEESGLIVDLGAWVLREACRAAAQWDDPATRINVNLSGRQLADPDVVEHVSTALRDFGLSPSRLTLEITESVLMQDTDSSVLRLQRLRDLGVSLAIDDFGTGYSSLAYLRAFPVQELKIDKSFIDAIADDAEARTLVSTILQLATTLKLRTVAEGVETAAQYASLRLLGCTRVQGYFVSRPQLWDDALAMTTRDRDWHVGRAVPKQRVEAAVPVLAGAPR